MDKNLVSVAKRTQLH